MRRHPRWTGGRTGSASDDGWLPVRHPLRPPRHRPISQLSRGLRPSLRDLAEDAVGLLDAFGLESAHLVGMSVGVDRPAVALDHPDRVASLTLISTSPTVGPSDPDLPEMSEELQTFLWKRPLSQTGRIGTP